VRSAAGAVSVVVAGVVSAAKVALGVAAAPVVAALVGLVVPVVAARVAAVAAALVASPDSYRAWSHLAPPLLARRGDRGVKILPHGAGDPSTKRDDSRDWC